MRLSPFCPPSSAMCMTDRPRLRWSAAIRMHRTRRNSRFDTANRPCAMKVTRGRMFFSCRRAGTVPCGLAIALQETSATRKTMIARPSSTTPKLEALANTVDSALAVLQDRPIRTRRGGQSWAVWGRSASLGQSSWCFGCVPASVVRHARARVRRVSWACVVGLR